MLTYYILACVNKNKIKLQLQYSSLGLIKTVAKKVNNFENNVCHNSCTEPGSFFTTLRHMLQSGKKNCLVQSARKFYVLSLVTFLIGLYR